MFQAVAVRVVDLGLLLLMGTMVEVLGLVTGRLEWEMVVVVGGVGLLEIARMIDEMGKQHHYWAHFSMEFVQFFGWWVSVTAVG